MGAHAGVQSDAAPARAMGVDQRIYVAFELRLSQGLDHDPAFPGAVVLHVPVLDRAAAADPEMRAKRRDPFRAGALDRQQPPAVRVMARHGRDLHALAAQRVRNIDALSVRRGDAVAEMADMIDHHALNHGVRR